MLHVVKMKSLDVATSRSLSWVIGWIFTFLKSLHNLYRRVAHAKCHRLREILRGDLSKKKELKRREKVAAACAQIWKKKHNAISGEIEPSNVCIGNRIVDIQVLAKNLKCKECKLHLSLQRIEKEIKRGLLSTFMVKCDQCQTLTRVDTGEFHPVAEDAQVYIKDKVHNNVTTNAVLGN